MQYFPSNRGRDATWRSKYLWHYSHRILLSPRHLYLPFFIVLLYPGKSRIFKALLDCLIFPVRPPSLLTSFQFHHCTPQLTSSSQYTVPPSHSCSTLPPPLTITPPTLTLPHSTLTTTLTPLQFMLTTPLLHPTHPCSTLSSLHPHYTLTLTTFPLHLTTKLYIFV